MDDSAEVLGEFEREDYVFTVLHVDKVYRIEARTEKRRPVLVGLIHHLGTPTSWSGDWGGDSWRSWIDQKARPIIAGAQQDARDRADAAAAQPDHIAE
ncbi:hypothetical protein [Glycomyces sp. NPDC047010]|uniref:hypothetical protein n=1 Tax=Glycomyces sp. NPDC047010 TaxID=3155023 RepID=UPI00340D4CEB